MQEHWAKIYTLPYRAGGDTKLQALQYRVIHRVLACNKFLKNISVCRTDKCSFCPLPDTAKHFLIEYGLKKLFWGNVSSWFDKEGDIQLSLSVRSRLFGVRASQPHSSQTNFLLMFVKSYIYRQKLFNVGAFSLIQLLRELRQRLQAEKYITALDNKLHKFTKWNRIYKALG